MVAVRALVRLVPLKEFRVLLQLLLVGEGLRTVFAFEGQVRPMLGFDVRLQVGLIGATEDAMLALVRLLPRVGPHVFFQLRRVAEAFPALHANVGEVLAVNREQVPVQQALLRGFVVAIFALVQFGFFIAQDEFVGTQRAGFSVAPGVLGEFVRFVPFVDQLMAFQVIVEADFFVGCEVTVCALVFLLNHVIWVVFHMPFQESPGLEFFPTYVTRIDCQGLSVGTYYNSWVK